MLTCQDASYSSSKYIKTGTRCDALHSIGLSDHSSSISIFRVAGMVQGTLPRSSPTPRSNGVYAPNTLIRSGFLLLERSRMTGRTERCCLLQPRLESQFLSSRLYMPKPRNATIKAAWLFNGGNKGLDASVERSESANEDILVFFLQLDLATRAQYALNLEQYDFAQQLRNKLTEIDEEIIRKREARKGPAAKSEAQDQAIRILRLCADRQSAIEQENYAQAAELRDAISKLEAEALAASAKALAYENVQYQFRLGQRVKHKIFGYKGIICGMDPICCESRSWMETANVEKLSQGSNQPFYQVLVDVHEDPELLVAYVAEENLLAPDKPDLGRFDHPYASFLFYGMDTAGDYIPVKQLREKYNQPRHEVPFDEEEEDDGSED